jgi:hypothetical protein
MQVPFPPAISRVEVAHMSAPDGIARITLQLRAPDNRMILADLSGKSVRKAIASVREYGTDHCVAMVQEKLVRTATGDELAEAGLSAQQKTVTAKAA